MSRSARVVLLGRAGCHLCDEARDVVARVCTAAGVTWTEQDVDASPDLLARYSDHVPVVLVDGVPHSRFRVDAARLRAALG